MSDAVAALVELLHATDLQLESLLDGQVDAVTNKAGRTMLLQRAQGHLRDSESARQSAVLSALPAYVALLDARGQVVMVNDAWRVFVQAHPAAVADGSPGLGFASLCDGVAGYSRADAIRAATGIGDVLAARLLDFSMEYACDAPGAPRRFLLRVTPLPGRPSRGAVVMHLDITERQLAAEELTAMSARTTRRERMLSTMLSASLDFASLYDRDARVLFANQPLLDLWGLTLEQAVGRDSVELLQGDMPGSQRHDLATKLRAQILGVVASGTLVAEEVTAVNNTGQEASYEYIYAPAFAADGSVDFVVGNTRVTTERKLAERAVRRQYSELRALLDLMPAMVWFKDTKNNILRVNEKVAAAAGLTVSQMEGRPAQASYPADAAQQYVEDLPVIVGKTPQLGVVREARDAQGASRWIQTDKVPYFDEGGAVIGLVVLDQDITSHKQDQEALRELNSSLEGRVEQRTREAIVARNEAQEANRAKSRFLATMSHEIRTPLNGLMGLLELLSLSPLDAEQMAILEVARGSGSGLLRIVDDVLDFAKIEADRLELANAVGSIRQTMEATCRLHLHGASTRNLVLAWDVDDAVSAWHEFDPLRLGQILSNLVSNAIKFTHAGRIDVSVTRLDARGGVERLQFLVRDTGIGVSPEQMARLFHPFAQAEATTSGSFGGTGLGLVICQRLAELMGGTLVMTSELGLGTHMTLTVPLVVATADALPPSGQAQVQPLRKLLLARRKAPGQEQARREGTLLMLVDDHPINRMMLLRQLEALGYNADAFEDGVSALEAWVTGIYAGLLTDCNMPRMNGYQLASRIRSLEASASASRKPIIGCTANALASATSDCLEAGMDAVLVKPAGLAALGEMLDLWIPLPVPLAEHAVEESPPQRSAGPLGVFSLALVDSYCAGDPEMRRKMLASYCEAARADAMNLHNAVTQRRRADVRHHAHRIKGASAMLGGIGLSNACQLLEDNALTWDVAALQTAWSGIERELDLQFAAIEHALVNGAADAAPSGSTFPRNNDALL